MPANLAFVLREIPKWFFKSVTRRDAYKELFETFEGCSVESSTIPLPFQKCNLTRWLVRGKVIFNILTNWEILKMYFTLIEGEGEANVRYKARLLKEMLQDPINYLYFHFLSRMVSEFERVNACFQATDIEASEAVRELNTYYYSSLRGRVYNSSGDILPTERVDYGAKFIYEADALIRRNKNDQVTVRKVREVYGRCHSLLLEAAEQVKKRLPPSKDIFNGLSYLHPSRILSQTARVPLASLPMQHLINEKVQEIDNLYRSILYVDWQESGVFKDGIPTDAVSFWSGVLDYRNLVGNSTYGDLAAYALACLTTPTSNAVVERIFICHMNKDKVKEQDDLFHTRSHCKDSQPFIFQGEVLQELCRN